MQYEVQVIETEAELTAVIRHTLLRSEVRHNLLTPSITEVLQTLARQGLKPGGPVFSRHLTLDPYFFDFEIGVPVDVSFQPAGRVVASTLPTATVARVLHQGPYEGLAGAWTRLREEIARAGLFPGDELWECYLTGPAESADPACWYTELYQPLDTTVPRSTPRPRDASYPEVMPSLRPSRTSERA